jgi:L-iditol 2-dehydrogenase
MRIARLLEPGRFELAQEPLPEPGPGDVLLRVLACGVCASELDIYRGLAGHAAYPWYPGHEVSGVVERTGADVVGLAPGDEVTMWGTARGYAERIAAPAAHCFSIGGVPPELALGEPLACAVNAAELADVRLGDDVVIVGAGFMGHLIHRLVELRGPRQVIVADTRDDALKRAEAMGATAVVNVGRESLTDVVRDLTGGLGADVGIEITGVQAGLDAVGQVTRMSGTVVIAGYHQGPARSVPLGQWNWMAFRIANAHFRSVDTILHGMRTGVRLLTSGRLTMQDLVTHRFALDEIDEAFRTAIEKPEGFVKAVVVP